MNKPTIAFIGGGNMAGGLLAGLIADNYDTHDIWVADPDQDRLQRLSQQFSVQTTTVNAEAARAADVIVLAVKPQVLPSVCESLTETMRAKTPLIISIAAGTRTDHILQWLNCQVPLIRTMPNTPAAFGAGATALYATESVSDEQKSLAESLMRSVGITVWVTEERLIDTVTALSGSGPAYFFLIMEALEESAMELGLDAEVARLLTLQTAFGAAKMALESNTDVQTLRKQVTSPGGTTESAIKTLEQGEIRKLFKDTLIAAQQRAEELAEMLGGSK